MVSHVIKESKKDNPFSSGAKKSSWNNCSSKDLIDDMDLEPLEEITERVGRSQSHFVFQFRPEHVPKPNLHRPKKAFVQPTPMILCLKSIQEVESQPLFANAGDPYLSCPESDREMDVSTEEADETSPKVCSIAIQRKEMNRIRSKTFVDSNGKAKDCDAIEGKDKTFLKKVMEEEIPNKRSSIFSKSIKTIIKKEREDCKRMSIGPSMRARGGLSLLKILEISAKKINSDNEKHLSLMESRMKRSSTIV